MRLGYLLASFPMTSTTFIRREIEAVEALGLPVTRLAVRHWDGRLVDPADIADQARTEYLLTGRAAALIGGALVALVTRPHEIARALPEWVRLVRRARGGPVRHLGYFLQAIRLRTRARALGLDHLHVHFATNAAAVAMLCRLMGGPAYSITVHGPDELVDPIAGSLAAKVRHAAFVVAITGFCRGVVVRAAPAEAGKVHVIACGIPLEDYAPSPPPPAGARRLVCVGRLCANKGQAFIPAAVARLRKRFPELVIELIGDGEERGAIEAEIAKHDVGGQVILSGWKDGAGVTASIKAARALLLPSFAEGLPIVIMEALALGRPVLTTPVAGIPELVDASCGWLFPPGDPERMADAIAAMLAAPGEAIAAMGAAGRARVAARHDLNRQAVLLAALFRSQGRPLSRD